MTKKSSHLFRLVGKITKFALTLALAGVLVVPMPAIVYAEGESTASSVTVENGGDNVDLYANRPLAISDEFGGSSQPSQTNQDPAPNNSSTPTTAPAQSQTTQTNENNFRTTGAINSGEGSFNTGDITNTRP